MKEKIIRGIGSWKRTKYKGRVEPCPYSRGGVLPHPLAEKFINLITKQKLDYTLWRQTNLDDDMSIRELSKKAMEYYNNTNKWLVNKICEV